MALAPRLGALPFYHGCGSGFLSDARLPPRLPPAAEAVHRFGRLREGAGGLPSVRTRNRVAGGLDALRSVALTINATAVVVQRAIESVLFTFRQMPAMSGFVARLALGDVGQVLLISGFLLRIDLAVGDTVLDAILLVVQPLIDFIDPRMVGDRIGEVLVPTRYPQRIAEREGQQT